MTEDVRKEFIENIKNGIDNLFEKVTQEKQEGTSLKGFLNVVHETFKFICEQRIEGQRLTTEQRIVLLEIVKVLMKGA